MTTERELGAPLSRRHRFLGGVGLVALVALTAVALWKTGGGPRSDLVAVVRTPGRIMGTTCTLVAVVSAGERAAADRKLEEAENALRRVDALMSTYLEQSEVSVLNTSEAGVPVPLSPWTRRVIAASREVTRRSRGAFDPTCRPLIDLWRKAGTENRMPASDEQEEARQRSSWDDFEIIPGGVRKRRAGATLDFGGVAKGFGIDRAFDVLRDARCQGILVDVGGDVRVGGLDDRGEPWRITVRDPFRTGTFCSFELPNGAVCTSGSYERSVEIAGRRFSHIVDPRSGLPAERLPSVTVVAADAMTADAWATALSVLGAEGLADLPPGVEALLVEGDERECTLHTTAGMGSLLPALPAKPCRSP